MTNSRSIYSGRVYEAGNGIPDVGDFVSDGTHLFSIVELVGPIHTGGSRGNYNHAILQEEGLSEASDEPCAKCRIDTKGGEVISLNNRTSYELVSELSDEQIAAIEDTVATLCAEAAECVHGSVSDKREWLAAVCAKQRELTGKWPVVG